MPSVSDILFGLRNLLFVSLCLLLVSALAAFLFGAANITYPANEITSFSLWAAVLVGSFATSRNLPRIDKGWLIGGVAGAAFGLVVTLVMAVLYNMGGSLSGDTFLSLLLLIVTYAVLGLVGAFVGSATVGPRKDY